MKWGPFQARVPGKWVLAGEHAVLRGAKAVALPHPDLALSMSFEPDSQAPGLLVHPPEASEPILRLLASVPLEPRMAGVLRIRSTLPQGAGLGSSAALCVAVTRWVASAIDLPQTDFQDFATRLENQFHGKSSGMDVAVTLLGEPVSFLRGQKPLSLGIDKLPRFTFHDTGLRASTRDCVAKVEVFLHDNPKEGRLLDELMSQASTHAIEGLKAYDSGACAVGLEHIARAMTESQECFEGWGLVPVAIRGLQHDLLARGARAAKLTGAGAGGVLVALWND